MFPFIRAITLALLSAWTLGAWAVDVSVLKLPAGARVVVVVFEDLEGPECANAYPLVWEAADAHKVPVMLYDFPLPRHNWSFDAAVWARYFDTQDTKAFKIGNEFRRYIYANQKQISRENLQQWVQRFAAEHEVTLPAGNDTDGKLAEKVKADYALGQRIGVEHTPTIWVISNNAVSPPLVEEVKDSEQLSQMMDDMLKKAGPAAATKNPATKAPKLKKSALNRQEKQNQGVKP